MSLSCPYARKDKEKWYRGQYDNLPVCTKQLKVIDPLFLRSTCESFLQSLSHTSATRSTPTTTRARAAGTIHDEKIFREHACDGGNFRGLPLLVIREFAGRRAAELENFGIKSGSDKVGIRHSSSRRNQRCHHSVRRSPNPLQYGDRGRVTTLRKSTSTRSLVGLPRADSS